MPKKLFEKLNKHEQIFRQLKAKLNNFKKKENDTFLKLFTIIQLFQRMN